MQKIQENIVVDKMLIFMQKYFKINEILKNIISNWIHKSYRW